jgi:hypothetical protein
MTDSPHGACPPSRNPALEQHAPLSPEPISGSRPEHFFPVLQHAPRGVDVQDLRPLRGRPCGPILDPDAYPGAPNCRTKKVKN